MDGDNMFHLNNIFENLKKDNEDGAEYWLGRELQVMLGYKSWRSFLAVINKAKFACVQSGIDTEVNFIEIPPKSGKQGKKSDYHLSRFACYLTIENANPAFETVSWWKSYFSVRARKQEVTHAGSNYHQKHSDDIDFAAQATHLFIKSQTEGKIKREGITGKDEENQARNIVERAVNKAISELSNKAQRNLSTPDNYTD